MKLGLIGGKDIGNYTIANYLWNKISSLSGIKFNFDIVPLTSKEEVCKFYWEFLENSDFLGFNVALPWKGFLADLVGNDRASSLYQFINTVYKEKNSILSTNTDPLGIVNPLIKLTDIKNKKILILGAGGAGCATAVYLVEKYRCKVFIFDIAGVNNNCLKVLVKLKTYHELLSHKYDVIINATPVGKYYLNTPPVMFCSPLGISMLKRITKPESIVQEMNYFPLKTELLTFALNLKLRVISGTEMLMNQALESFKKYTGFCLSEDKKEKLLKYINEVAYEKEQQLFKGTFVNFK